MFDDENLISLAIFLSFCLSVRPQYIVFREIFALFLSSKDTPSLNSTFYSENCRIEELRIIIK